MLVLLIFQIYPICNIVTHKAQLVDCFRRYSFVLLRRKLLDTSAQYEITASLMQVSSIRIGFPAMNLTDMLTWTTQKTRFFRSEMTAGPQCPKIKNPPKSPWIKVYCGNSLCVCTAKDTGHKRGRNRRKKRPPHKMRGASWVRQPVAGAGDGNRTRVASLGSWNSAIELHLHLV